MNEHDDATGTSTHDQNAVLIESDRSYRYIRRLDMLTMFLLACGLVLVLMNLSRMDGEVFVLSMAGITLFACTMTSMVQARRDHKLGEDATSPDRRSLVRMIVRTGTIFSSLTAMGVSIFSLLN